MAFYDFTPRGAYLALWASLSSTLYVSKKHKLMSIYAVHAIQLCCFLFCEASHFYYLCVCKHAYASEQRQVVMACIKKEVESEWHIFNKTWTAQYFFTELKVEAMCLVCGAQVAIIKKYNLKHRQCINTRTCLMKSAAVETHYVLSHKIARKRKGWRVCVFGGQSHKANIPSEKGSI